MYKSRRRIALTVIETVVTVIFIVLSLLLIPQTSVNDYKTYSILFPIFVTAILFSILLVTGTSIYDNVRQSLEKSSLEKGETAILSNFIENLRFCYSYDDFYGVISSELEDKADCSVLFVDKSNNYVLYNSPAHLTNNKNVIEKLLLNYQKNWQNGFFYMGDDFGIVSHPEKARGFFISHDGVHFFVFCRYTRLFDTEIMPRLYEEFSLFQRRSQIISGMSDISELSKEWEQLADAQKSFLPHKLPEVNKVKFGAYFRPLINVSGDYYTVLPIDEHKTLVMLGDVSGKGLAAALVMGLVINTVKIMENKEDLPGIINAVDKAIKDMQLQDKYTVVFIGIIDTQKMNIRYVNASMSDPIVVTRSPDGYRIKPLSSNCSIVGIIPLDEIQVAEQRLFSGDLILMASDGVSEVMNDEGIELGDTELYTKTIKTSASKDPDGFIKDIMDLIMSYNGGKKLRDDVTMLVAKVQG